jgi:hypothetical protein
VHQREGREYVYKNDMPCARTCVCVRVYTARINATYVCVRNADIGYRYMTFHSSMLTFQENNAGYLVLTALFAMGGTKLIFKSVRLKKSRQFIYVDSPQLGTSC